MMKKFKMTYRGGPFDGRVELVRVGNGIEFKVLRKLVWPDGVHEYEVKGVVGQYEYQGVR